MPNKSNASNIPDEIEPEGFKWPMPELPDVHDEIYAADASSRSVATIAGVRVAHGRIYISCVIVLPFSARQSSDTDGKPIPNPDVSGYSHNHLHPTE